MIWAGRVVRYTGSSNYPAWRLAESLWISRSSGLTQFVSHQPHYNLVHRAEFERELADLCRTYAIGVIPYSPLAGGFLTGKYRKDRNERPG
jgi:aryl-alcohol dehydrogenase-like predicted oxidoreductase